MKFLAILAVLAIAGYMLFGSSAGSPVKGKPVFTQVITASGKKADAAPLLKQKVLLLYFSAHWCPPCRAFTPELVKYYNDNGGGKQFDVLFVSADESRDDMLGYMGDMDMPWRGPNSARIPRSVCGRPTAARASPAWWRSMVRARCCPTASSAGTTSVRRRCSRMSASC